jgi:hypothetical protein
VTINACPHCGDTDSGYIYKAIEHTTRGGQWGEGCELIQTEKLDAPKNVTCQKCGKRVDYHKATGT